MARQLLSDEAWELISDLIPPAKHMGRPLRDRRVVLDGILWILRSGAPWRDLPEEFGAWKTCWRTFDEWNRTGVLHQILARLHAASFDVDDIDLELWCVDGTVVRAHRCCAGGAKKGIPTSLLTMR